MGPARECIAGYIGNGPTPVQTEGLKPWSMSMNPTGVQRSRTEKDRVRLIINGRVNGLGSDHGRFVMLPSDPE